MRVFPAVFVIIVFIAFIIFVSTEIYLGDWMQENSIQERHFRRLVFGAVLLVLALLGALAFRLFPRTMSRLFDKEFGRGEPKVAGTEQKAGREDRARAPEPQKPPMATAQDRSRTMKPTGDPDIERQRREEPNIHVLVQLYRRTGYRETNDPKTAYELGLADLRHSFAYIGKPPAGLFYLMPYAVAVARNGWVCSQHHIWPEFASLSALERQAVEIVHRCVTGSREDVESIWETALGGQLLEPTLLLFREAEKQWGLTLHSKNESIFDRVYRNNSELPAPEWISLRESLDLKKPDPSLASSWFGGRPRLGAEPWPRTRSGACPLHFVAQISLADIAEQVGPSPLPQQGSLAFFMGRDLLAEGGQTECAVIHVDGTAAGDPSSIPDDMPSVAQRLGTDEFPNPETGRRRVNFTSGQSS